MDMALEPPQEAQQFIWEAKQAITALESEDEGFVHSFRSIIRQLVNIFDHAHSEAHAKLRLQQLRQDIHALGDPQLEKIPQFFDDHWDQALRYLRKKGMGKHRRGSNSESGMRLLRKARKTMMGSGLQQPDSTTFRSIRR